MSNAPNCRECGRSAAWLIESAAGESEAAVTYACDVDLADVLRSLPDVQPIVTEVLPSVTDRGAHMICTTCRRLVDGQRGSGPSGLLVNEPCEHATGVTWSVVL